MQPKDLGFHYWTYNKEHKIRNPRNLRYISKIIIGFSFTYLFVIVANNKNPSLVYLFKENTTIVVLLISDTQTNKKEDYRERRGEGRISAISMEVWVVENARVKDLYIVVQGNPR